MRSSPAGSGSETMITSGSVVLALVSPLLIIPGGGVLFLG